MQSDNHNIGAIIADQARQNPDAVSIEQDGQRYTRGQIMTSAHALADFFRAHGVGPGANVGIVAVDRLRTFEAVIALWACGAVVLCLDCRQTIGELQAAQDKAGLDIVFTDSKSFARRGGMTLIPPRVEIAPLGTEMTFSDASGDSDAVILSSSGTTGLPRYRRKSHRSVLQGLRASGAVLDLPVLPPSVSVGSLAFGAILMHWVKAFVYGTFMISLPLLYRTSDLHAALSRPDIEFVGLPPVVITDLLAFHSERCASADGCAYPHITRLSSIGGPISPDDLVRAYQKLTPHVRNMYSMSGVGAVSVLSGPDIEAKPRSVGRPFPQITVKIEDDTGAACAAGQVGRIYAKSNLMGDAILVDTGDLGWQDDDGFLFIAGRSDQIVTRKSVNISLTELETDVKNIEGVRDCIAFSALADGSLDDLVFLAVEARADGDTLKNTIRSSLASFRRPDRILVTQRLPRTMSDKIALAELKRMSTVKEAGFVDL